MAIKYCVIEIYTSEDARYAHTSLPEAVVDYLLNQKIAARCLVMRGTEGCYETGEMVTQRLLELSFNMPVKIEILLPTQERDRVLSRLQDMVSEGVVTVREVSVHTHAFPGGLIPRQIKVRDVMTANPVTVTPATSVKAIIHILLSHSFNGLPVVDEYRRAVGMVTQADLLHKAHMPLRLGLLAQLNWDQVDPALAAFDHQKASDVMNKPAITIGKDKSLAHAVDVMLEKRLKRLPVVDKDKLVGMLARSDIFHTITKASPTWQAANQTNLKPANLRQVAGIMRRDAHTVRLDTPVEDVVRIIDATDIQRIAVTDNQGRFMGLISDRDLLAAFSEYHPGIWKRLISAIVFTEKGERHKALGSKLRRKKASEVMQTDLITIREQTGIDEAIRIMTEKRLKRLPVVAPDGTFQGIVSRDSVLRAGLADSQTSKVGAFKPRPD